MKFDKKEWHLKAPISLAGWRGINIQNPPKDPQNQHWTIRIQRQKNNQGLGIRTTNPFNPTKSILCCLRWGQATNPLTIHTKVFEVHPRGLWPTIHDLFGVQWDAPFLPGHSKSNSIFHGESPEQSIVDLWDSGIRCSGWQSKLVGWIFDQFLYRKIGYQSLYLLDFGGKFVCWWLFDYGDYY